jgi:hypothetical protein
MSEILDRKINSKIFEEYFTNLLNEIGDKKVLIYGAGPDFEKLDKKFNLKKLNVVAISDLKFTEMDNLQGLKSIPPSTIPEYDYDVILMTLIDPEKALEYLEEKLGIKKEIKQAFEEIIPQENEFLNYFEDIKLEKHLEKISKKLKDKKVVIYGVGVFFQVINAYYDLSKLNIIALSDRKYTTHVEGEKFLGYPVCGPDEIKGLNPDYVLVAIRFFINIIEDLEDNTLKKSKIKVRPLIRKPFMELLSEIWG